MLSNLSAIDTIYKAAVETGSLVLLVPAIVMRELDGLKLQNTITHQSGHPETVSTLARRAINWLLETMSSQHSTRSAVLRGQRKDDTLRPLKALDASTHGTSINDDIILDVALFHQQRGRSVCLLTGDKNLLLRAQVEQIWALDVPRIPIDQILTRLGLNQAVRRRGDVPIAGNAERAQPRPVPLVSASDMMVDEEVHVPLSAGPMPPMLPVREPADVLLNMALLFHHFLAPIVYQVLRSSIDSSTTNVTDWRTWTADDVVYALRNEWQLFRPLCEQGLAFLPARPPASPSRIPSKWAAPSPQSSSNGITRKKETAKETAADVENCLPSLLQAFLSIHASIPIHAMFTAARWQVVLESLQLVMKTFISADQETDVSEDVEHLVSQWRAQLVEMQCIKDNLS